MIRDHVSDWLFNYNNITKTWRAVKRDDQAQMFNGGKGRMESRSFDTLLELINRTNGNSVKLNKLIKK